jgi:hypothetical protein
MPSDTLWEIANKSFHIWCAGHSQWVYMHIYIPNCGPPQKESNWWPCYKFWHQITLCKFPHLQQFIVVATSQLQMGHTCPEGVWGLQPSVRHMFQACISKLVLNSRTVFSPFAAGKPQQRIRTRGCFSTPGSLKQTLVSWMNSSCAGCPKPLTAPRIPWEVFLAF